MAATDIGLKIVLLGVKEFNRSVDSIEKDMKAVNKSMDSTGTSTKNASTNISDYSESAGKATTNTKTLAVETSSFSEKMSTLGATATKVGAILTASLTVPLNALRAKMIDTGISFEDSFAGVSKTVDGISDDFGALTGVGQEFRKNLIDLSLELPITADELATVAAMAGQVGVPFGKSGETLLEFTKIAAQMGVATNVSAEESATALARVANIYGIAAEDMIDFSSGFSNALVALGNTTAATEQEILNMTMRLAPAANLAGIAADETLALAASMTEMGINAEAGGTALSTVLLTMTEASKAASGAADAQGEASKKLQEGFNTLHRLLKQGETDLTTYEYALLGSGVSIDGLGSKLKEYEKGLISFDDVMQHVSMKTQIDMQDALAGSTEQIAIFAEILGVSENQFASAFGAEPLQTLQRFLSELADLQDAGKVSSETLSKLGFSGVRVRQVLNTLGPNMENLTDNVNMSNKAWVEQTALQVEAQKKFATTKAKIDLMKNTFNALSIAVFDYVKPAFDASIQTITNLIKTFKGFFQASDENRAIISKLFIAASLLGPALIAVGVALRTISLLNLSSVFAPLIAIATNPIVLMGIGAIAAGFILVKKNIFGLGKLFDEVSHSLSNVFQLFSMFFTQGSIVDPLKDMAKSFMAGDISGAIENFQKAWDELLWWVETILGPALEVEFAKIKVRAQDSIRKAGRWLENDGIKLLGKFVDRLKVIVPKIWEQLKEWGQAFIGWIEPYIPQIVKELWSITKAVVAWVVDAIPAVIEQLQEWGTAIVDWFNSGGKEQIIEGATNLFNGIIDVLSSINFENVILALVEALGFALGAISTLIVGLIIEVGKLLSTVDWGSVLSSVGDFLEKVFARFSQGILAGIIAIMGKDKFDKLMADIIGWLSKSTTDRLKDFINIGGSILSGIWEGIKYVWNSSLKPFLSDLFNDFIDFVKGILGIASPSTVFMDIGESIVQGLWDGIKFIWNLFKSYVVERVSDFILWFTEKIPEVLQFGKDVITNIWNGMKELWDSFSAWVTEKVTSFLATFTNIIADILNFGKNIVVSIQGGIQSGWDAFKNWVGQRAQDIKDKFTGLIIDMFNIGKDIVDGLKRGIEDAFDLLPGWMQDLMEAGWDTVAGFLGLASPSKLYASAGKGMVDGLIKGIEKEESGLLNTLSNLSSDMIMTTQMGIETQPISQAMLGAATGSTITTSNITSGDTNNARTFAPTINTGPITNADSLGNEMSRQWRIARLTGNI